MTATAATAPRLRTALVIAGAWTTFGVLASAHFFLSASSDRASFVDLATHIVTFYWAWAILTPGILSLGRRASGLSGARRVVLVIGIVAAAVPLHGALYLTSLRLLEISPDARMDAANFMDYLRRHTGGDLATCALLVAFAFYAEMTRRAKERDTEAAKLEQRLARAEVEILRWQLQPHFLFNALNTVSTLVLKSDNARAEQAIALIARYLRTVLGGGSEDLVTFEDELKFVRSYVDIEKLRFGDELVVEQRVADDALSQRIPAMVLQPLVENAIRHGAAVPGSQRRIGIDARVSAGRVLVSVSNPIAGSAHTMDGNGGFGLPYVRQRLAHWYGTSARLEITAVDGNAIVNLDIPVTR